MNERSHITAVYQYFNRKAWGENRERKQEKGKGKEVLSTDCISKLSRSEPIEEKIRSCIVTSFLW